MWKADAKPTLPIGNNPNRNSGNPPENCNADPEAKKRTGVCRICAEKTPNEQCNAEMHRCCACMQEFPTKTWPMHTIKKPHTLSETDARMHKVQQKRLHNK